MTFITVYRSFHGHTDSKLFEGLPLYGLTKKSQNRDYLIFFRFTQLDKEDKGHLSRDDLMAIPELAINPLAERIVDLFLPQHSQSLEATQCTFMKFCEVHFLFIFFEIIMRSSSLRGKIFFGDHL